ncbi:transketolase [uncultured Duncaniella sp.]|uniref:transketolase family protein n=1 Tax=uncultured Duncaniella sp. TaxID=2768039 RepID=UPI0026771A18|nr:transketolase [uncultured Duncaniella sp.]
MDLTTMNSAADNLRVLITEMVEKANSGHPGGALGAADFINVLYSKFLVYDPKDPRWFVRDRFFLDPGHMSPMLYSVLALAGKFTMEDLQNFRQWGSVTPGHPELDVERGIENSSGPLGQGHVMAVGCAIAERFLAARFGEVVAHKTYAFISDGGIQEEVSQGAGRIAGHLGLHNLIMFYDANNVQLSTKVDAVDSEDVAAKYRAWNWNVLEVDGSDAAAIAAALSVAIEERERPVLIIGHTTMARKVVATGGGSLEGAVSTHGQPLSKAGADITASVAAMGGDPENPWVIRPEVKKLYEDRAAELETIVAERRARFSRWAEENPAEAELLRRYESLELPDLDWSQVEIKPGQPTRAASAACLGFLAEHVGNMIVSSADLANSDKTDGFLKKTGELVKDNFSGGFLQAGVAELTMACIMNGIVLHGGMYAACGTFFVFSDYMKPAIRMASLMELPVKFIYSHDSFRVGEDGPTHEPIEHEAQIRLLEQMSNLSGRPSLLVIRPADSAETVAAYKMAMENDKTPTVLILSRQNLEDLPGENRREEAMNSVKGGYVVRQAATPDVVLVANGSDVALLLHAAEELAAEGVNASVVSMPSVGLFKAQDQEYQNSVMPAGVRIFGLTSGLPATLYPVMRGEFEVMGLERFGASAPAKVLEEKFGYTVSAVKARIRKFLGL